MKQKIKLTAKDRDKTVVSIELSIDCKIYVLTGDEQKAFKEDLNIKAFDLLRSVGFSPMEIEFK